MAECSRDALFVGHSSKTDQTFLPCQADIDRFRSSSLAYRPLLMVLLLAIGFQLPAISLAQSLTFGIYGRLSPNYLTPTLEASYPLGELSLGLRLQQGAFGVSAESATELGPAGRFSYGARASLGFAGWGLEAFARGGVAQVALEAALAYASTPRNTLWVGDTGPAGLSGGLLGRYRLSSRDTLGLYTEYSGLWTFEGSYALRDSATYTFGLGYRNGVYAMVGWRGELDEEGTLLEALLRAGLRNELEAALFTALDDATNLKLRLTLAYPLAAKVGLEMDAFRLEASYDGGFALWLRYTINLGGE